MENKAQDDDLVMNLVELALAQPEQERRAFLQRVCADDSELFNHVWDYVQWEARMQGFLLDPLYPPPLNEHPFHPGDLLDGRFRIIREVAQGGMGVVYEAMDERLDRRIAIKCAKTGFRKRLPPEVRNASEISHPNVCKIFEIHTTSTRHGEIDFLTMEFLEGETLAERLLRARLAEGEAHTIARQLCAGLAEAHRNKVIHGDLKSNNVILTTGKDGGTRAVITDFGLAQRPGAEYGTAQSGALRGTPDYMAPELWKGEKASVASDIYALGVIFYELVSGRKPYGPELLPEERIVRSPPAVHPKWDRILLRCLDPDPARRFQDADEIAQALAPRSRRWFLAAAAAVVLAVVSGVVTYQRATVPPESVRLAMLPFVSTKDTAPFADSVLRDTTAQLARLKGSSHTKFVFVPLTKTLRSRVTIADQARSALGATHVLNGTLTKENDNVILHVYLTDARSLVNGKEWTAQYPMGELRYIPVALAGLVTGTLRLPQLAIPRAVNLSARENYEAGLSRLRQDTGVDSALALMEQAVTSDPDSALTHAGLAEAEWFKYFLSKDLVWLDRSAESARQAERRNPDLAPVHRVLGLHLANAGSYEQAAAEYRRAIELEPQDAETYRRLGQVYEQSNQIEDALTAFQTAVSIQPHYYRAHQELGAYYYNRAAYTRAVASLKEAVDLAPDEPNVRFGLGQTYLNLGRYVEAERELRLAVGLAEAPNALHSLGLALMYQARDEEATPYFSRALRRNPEGYLSWMYLGIAYRRTNQLDASRQANRRGQEVAEVEMARNPRSGYVRSILGYFHAALGDRSGAESETAQALRLSPDDAETRWIAALTYEALNQRQASLAVLSRSSPQQIADISRWPDVADLNRDSRFMQLAATK